MPPAKPTARDTDSMRHGRASAAALLNEIRRIHDGQFGEPHAVARTEEALKLCLDRYAAAANEQKREFVAVLADYLGQTVSGIKVDPAFYVPPDINEALELMRERSAA